MKIVVTSREVSLNSPVDPRFGRCQYFMVIEPKSMEWEARENSKRLGTGGAGIAAAQDIVSFGDVEAVITGNVGPNAFGVLLAAGIEVVTGYEGTVSEAVHHYVDGLLTTTKGPTVQSHHGMGK